MWARDTVFPLLFTFLHILFHFLVLFWHAKNDAFIELLKCAVNMRGNNEIYIKSHCNDLLIALSISYALPSYLHGFTLNSMLHLLLVTCWRCKVNAVQSIQTGNHVNIKKKKKKNLPESIRGISCNFQFVSSLWCLSLASYLWLDAFDQVWRIRKVILSRRGHFMDRIECLNMGLMHLAVTHMCAF